VLEKKAPLLKKILGDYMKKIIPIMAVLAMLMMTGAMGAATITAPANNAVLTIGENYEFLGTSDLTGAAYNCTWQYLHQGDSTWTTIGEQSGANKAGINATVPNSFGTNMIRIGCINDTGATRYTNGENSTTIATTMSISFNNYAAGEASEVTVDLIIAVGAVFVSVATLVGLVLLWGWIKRKV